MNPHRFKIAIVEDDLAWRDGVVAALDGSEGFAVTHTAESVATAIAFMAGPPVDVMLVDLGLPDGSGIEVIREARRLRAAREILVTTVFQDEESTVAAICAGASGYVLKDEPVPELIRSLRDVLAGASPISPRIARHVLRAVQTGSPLLAGPGTAASHPSHGIAEMRAPAKLGLTRREIEVLHLIAKGFSHVEIAQLLATSPNTVRTHMKNIYRKLDVNSRGEAVYQAIQIGLV